MSLFEPELMSKALKPPSAEAVNRALRILLDSVKERNTKTKMRGHSTQGLLEEYRRDREALEVAHIALSKAAVSRMASVAQRRNGLIPVNKLPVELTADILLRSLTPGDEQAHRAPFIDLALVQTTWWRIIESFPAFWTTIHASKFNVSATRRMLEKSGALPLEIFCDGLPSLQDQRSMLAMMKKHRNRIRSFTYRWDGIDLLRKFLESSMPLLQNLTLAPADGQPEDGHFPIPRDSCLRQVEINGTFPRWGPNPTFTELRVFKWRYDSFCRTPPQEFMDVLRSFQQLEVLEMESIELNGRVDPAYQGPTIQLPSLHTLWITEVSEEYAVPLLTSIQSDHLTVFKMTQHAVDIDELVPPLLSHQRPQPPLSALLRKQNLSHIDLTMDGTALKIEGTFEGEGELCLDLHWYRPWLRELARIPQLCFTACEVPITLRIHQSKRNVGSALVDFAGLNAVVAIHLDCGSEVALSVFQALSKPDEEDPNAPWSLPRLTGIYFGIGLLRSLSGADSEYREELADEVLSVLEERKGAAGTTPVTVYHTIEGQPYIVKDIRAFFQPLSSDEESDEELDAE